MVAAAAEAEARGEAAGDVEAATEDVASSGGGTLLGERSVWSWKQLSIDYRYIHVFVSNLFNYLFSAISFSLL